MPSWNKPTAVEWFTHRVGKRIRLREDGSIQGIRGVLRAVSEMDACSADFITATVDIGIPGLEVGLTFHEDALGLHALGKGTEGDGEVSLGMSIPYPSLILDEPTGGPQPSNEENQPGFYPYELLR